MDKVLGKWEELGFLDGISDENKPKLANQFQGIFTFMTTRPTKSKYDIIEALIFPIARKILESTEFDYIEPIELSDRVLSIMSTNEYKANEAELLGACYNTIDGEAEMTHYVIERYLEDYGG